MGKKTVRLSFIHPTDKPINEKSGKFGDPRHGGRAHKGLDYLAPKGTDVKASESGVVVKSENRPYREWRGNNYGETIVIDHIPDAGDKGRHIYTLYAHLDERFVSENKKVRQGESIGKSGNTGMKAFHEGKNSGFHLHFEVRDSEKKIEWNGWPDNYYKNPLGYLRQPKTVEYESSEGE